MSQPAKKKSKETPPPAADTDQLDVEIDYAKILEECIPSTSTKSNNNKQSLDEVAKQIQLSNQYSCPSGSYKFEMTFDIQDRDSDYTFESMFGIESNSPFESKVDFHAIPPPDTTKKSIVTRQVQAYYEGQKKMRVPTLPVDPSCYQLKSADRIIYEDRNNQYWESVLTQLGLDSEEHIKFIMKPDFLDILPQMLNKFKHGLMPTIDSTWTVAPRLNPFSVYDDLSKSIDYSQYFPTYEYDRANGVLVFSHESFEKPLRYKTNNDADLEHNAFRRVLVLINRKLNGVFDVIIRNLKHYGTSLVQSRNIPRFLGEADQFHTYSEHLNKYCHDLGDKDLTLEASHLYKTILRAKQFRYSFEERNKENLYYSEMTRSSYFRYEFFKPSADAQHIAIFAPDKRLTHSSLTSLLSSGKYSITMYSDMAFDEHGEKPTIYRRQVAVKATNDFLRLTSSEMNKFDHIYLDFVEVKVIGHMLFGSYCQANIIARFIQEKSYCGHLVARLGISPEMPLVSGYCFAAISIFKAGGLEYIASIKKANTDPTIWNRFMLSKLFAIKSYVEHVRRTTLLAGFGLMCHDYLRPIKDEICWTVPETAFNLTGTTFKPFAYQHTRQTNKFTVRSEDFLDNWVNLSREQQNPEDRIYTSALLHSNFDLDAAASLLDNLRVPNSHQRLRTVMSQMVRMNELPKDLLAAIRVSIVLPKAKSYLKKRCPNLDDYAGLFETVIDGDDPMLRFVGACEMVDEMRTIYDINNMRQKNGFNLRVNV